MKPVTDINIGGCFAFSPDGEHIAVAKKAVGRQMGRIVSVRSAKVVATVDRLPANTCYIEYAPDGKSLVFGSMREGVTICDPVSGDVLRRVKMPSDQEIADMAFLPGTDTLVHCTWRALSEIDAAAGLLVRSFDVIEPPDSLHPIYYAFAASPRGDRLAVSWDSPVLGQHISLIDWKSGSEIGRMWSRPYSIYHYQSAAHRMRFSEDGSAVLFTDSQSKLYSQPATIPCDCNAPPLLDRSRPGPGGTPEISPTAFDLSPDGSLLAFAYREVFEILTWPELECKGQWRLPGKNGGASQIRFARTGEYLGIASHRTIVYRMSDLV